MDGYIKKSEAVDVIVKYPYEIAGKTATAIKMIEDLPSADIVEVVRCKDCAHYIEMKGYDYNGRKAKSCVWHSQLRRENDYCSDGIRKGGK